MDELLTNLLAKERATESKLEEILKSLDAKVKLIYDSLPKNALLIVAAHGDINDAKG